MAAMRCGCLRILALCVLLSATLLPMAETAHAASSSVGSDTTDDEARSLSLATLSLNTLTTSCNGGCRTNSPCVVLGQSSENPIDCVNDVRCATLLNGKTALCMEAFGASDGTWAFSPAKSATVSGVAPFERVGLVQLGDQVTEVYDLVVFSPSMFYLLFCD